MSAPVPHDVWLKDVRRAERARETLRVLRGVIDVHVTVARGSALWPVQWRYWLGHIDAALAATEPEKPQEPQGDHA